MILSYLWVRRYSSICLGAALVAFSLELFYIPHRFIDGGITGLAVLLGRWTGVSPIWYMPPLNLACLVAGGRRVGARVIGGTMVGVVSLAMVLWLVGPLPRTGSPALAALAGGAMLGMGLGTVLLAGGTLDGSEILGLWLQQGHGLSLIWFLCLYNGLLFAAVAAVYGRHSAVHSVMAQSTALTVVAALLWCRAPHISVRTRPR